MRLLGHDVLIRALLVLLAAAAPALSAPAAAQMYLVLPNQAAADAINGAACVAHRGQGCDGVSTTKWWAEFQGPSGQVALFFEPGMRNGQDFTSASISTAQRAALVPFTTMQANGWFSTAAMVSN